MSDEWKLLLALSFEGERKHKLLFDLSNKGTINRKCDYVALEGKWKLRWTEILTIIQKHKQTKAALSEIQKHSLFKCLERKTAKHIHFKVVTVFILCAETEPLLVSSPWNL